MVTGVKTRRSIQPRMPAYGEKKSRSDARYPISQRPVPEARGVFDPLLHT
jgi:hypothetical protein